MASYKDLKELILKATSWERQLKDLYEVAELGLRDKEAKELASFLKDKLATKLEVLENIDVEKFGKSKWLRYAPDYKDEDVVPKKLITKESTPKQIFYQLVTFEQRIKEFYEKILDALYTESHRDLLTSLVTFKEEQINELERFIKNYKPVK